MFVSSVKNYSYISSGNNYDIQKNININKTNKSFGNCNNKGLNILGLYNRISFCALPLEKANLSQRAQIATSYLDNLRQSGKNIVGFRNLTSNNFEKIKDICCDIPVFSHLTARDLDLITKSFNSILLQRGCLNHCSHCGVNAPAKIETMTWENFVKLTDGISTLKKRIGFNPFSYYNQLYGDVVMPFLDSDPMMLKMRDSQNHIYDIADAAEEFYKKTQTKFVITTAGWPQNDIILQRAAEKLARNPQYITDIVISIHPFHRTMQQALKNKRCFKELEITDSDRAQKYFSEYVRLRKKYVNNMSNVLRTFMAIPPQENSLKISLEYLDSFGKDNDFEDLSLQCCQTLLSNIFNKVSDVGEYRGYFSNNLYPISIVSSGRAISYFNGNRAYYYVYYGQGNNIINFDGKILREFANNGEFTDEPLADTGYHLNFDN